MMIIQIKVVIKLNSINADILILSLIMIYAPLFAHLLNIPDGEILSR